MLTVGGVAWEKVEEEENCGEGAEWEHWEDVAVGVQSQ